VFYYTTTGLESKAAPWRHGDISRLWHFDSHSKSGGFECVDVYNHADSLGAGIKTILNIIGIVVILAGGTFFLQGINVLPGSYMSGGPQWVINGGIMILIGIGLLIWAWRKK